MIKITVLHNLAVSYSSSWSNSRSLVYAAASLLTVHVPLLSCRREQIIVQPRNIFTCARGGWLGGQWTLNDGMLNRAELSCLYSTKSRNLLRCRVTKYFVTAVAWTECLDAGPRWGSDFPVASLVCCPDSSNMFREALDHPTFDSMRSIISRDEDIAPPVREPSNVHTARRRGME